MVDLQIRIPRKCFLPIKSRKTHKPNNLKTSKSEKLTIPSLDRTSWTINLKLESAAMVMTPVSAGWPPP
jgi:hypothetical protein